MDIDTNLVGYEEVNFYSVKAHKNHLICRNRRTCGSLDTQPNTFYISTLHKETTKQCLSVIPLEE